jgi:hypothetical protein
MVASKMGMLPRLLVASQLLPWSLALPTEQAPLLAEQVVQINYNAIQATEQRPLHGRFLHMTGTRTTPSEEPPALRETTNMLQTSILIASTKYTLQHLKVPPAIMDKALLESTAPK